MGIADDISASIKAYRADRHVWEVAAAVYALADLATLLGHTTLDVTCDRCRGTGEERLNGIDPDWCFSCGGCGTWEQPGVYVYADDGWVC
jgi:hypothetical protein